MQLAKYGEYTKINFKSHLEDIAILRRPFPYMLLLRQQDAIALSYSRLRLITLELHGKIAALGLRRKSLALSDLFYIRM